MGGPPHRARARAAREPGWGRAQRSAPGPPQPRRAGSGPGRWRSSQVRSPARSARACSAHFFLRPCLLCSVAACPVCARKLCWPRRVRSPQPASQRRPVRRSSHHRCSTLCACTPERGKVLAALQRRRRPRTPQSTTCAPTAYCGAQHAPSSNHSTDSNGRSRAAPAWRLDREGADAAQVRRRERAR